MSETIQFSINHLDNIKQVIFGLQKQANVTNVAVVKLIARELSSTLGFASSSSTEEVGKAIEEYLNKVISKEISDYNEDVVMLIVGEESLANMKSGSPVCLYSEPISDTSPKCIYRIAILGEETAIDNSGELDVAETGSGLGPKVISGVAPNRADGSIDFRKMAEDLKHAILPNVPTRVKEDLAGDEYAQCLVCAKQFFAYNS